MKLTIKIIIPTLITLSLLVFCTDKNSQNTDQNSSKDQRNPTKHPDFNTYWYAGKAEITSYKLLQSRYGEIHNGTAVTIFVTEDFLPEKQVKADHRNDKNIPVMKLNSTKNFTTGIYPYAIMTSTFSPVDLHKKAIKVSFSAQEWCGNTFAQLNNKNNFEINFYSYFESNSDRQVSLKKDVLENELWNMLRINPENLPVGELNVIPSFEYLALNHQKIKAYKAQITLTEKDSLLFYSINYPELERSLTIKTINKFPYIIEDWEENIKKDGKNLTTKATKIKTIQSEYWSKNSVADVNERIELGLE